MLTLLSWSGVLSWGSYQQIRRMQPLCTPLLPTSFGLWTGAGAQGHHRSYIISWCVLIFIHGRCCCQLQSTHMQYQSTHCLILHHHHPLRILQNSLLVHSPLFAHQHLHWEVLMMDGAKRVLSDCVLLHQRRVVVPGGWLEWGVCRWENSWCWSTGNYKPIFMDMADILD